MNKCQNKCDTKVSLLADFLRVISDENRLKIICFLQSGEKCVCEIWQFLDLPQNLISHHLKVLRDFGLLNSRKDGLKVFYSIDEKELDKHKEVLHKILHKKEGNNHDC